MHEKEDLLIGLLLEQLRERASTIIYEADNIIAEMTRLLVALRKSNSAMDIEKYIIR